MTEQSPSAEALDLARCCSGVPHDARGCDDCMDHARDIDALVREEVAEERAKREAAEYQCGLWRETVMDEIAENKALFDLLGVTEKIVTQEGVTTTALLRKEIEDIMRRLEAAELARDAAKVAADCAMKEKLTAEQRAEDLEHERVASHPPLMNKVNAGAQIVVGVPYEYMAKLASGEWVGGLLLYSRKDYDEMYARLAAEPKSEVKPCFRRCTPGTREACADASGLAITVCQCECHA